jgi:ABC-type Mn2+/Zn2+ transport system permease subunit
VGALIDPFLDNEFLVRALVAGVLVAVGSAAVGTYVVLRGLAFIGEALGHGVLPGVAVAVLLGVSGLLGAAVAAGVMITGVSWITRRSILTSSTAIGLLFVGMLALGVVIVSRSEAFAGDLTRILFGDILGSGWDDVWVQLGVTIAVVVTVLICARPFLLLCFDREQAQTAGFSPGFYDGLMLTAIASTVVVSFQSVGTLLVLGMLLAPPGAAALFTTTIRSTIVLSACLGTVSVYAGLLVSYHFDLAAGAMVVLVAVGLFFAFLAARTVLVPSRLGTDGKA